MGAVAIRSFECTCSCLKMKFFHQVHFLICCCIFIATTSGQIPFDGQAVEERSNINYATVYTGVFDPNNIAIHVMQNFVNFAAGTVAWILFAATYPSVSRSFSEGRSLDSSAKDLSQMLRSAADTIDSFERTWSMVNRLNNIE